MAGEAWLGFSQNTHIKFASLRPKCSLDLLQTTPGTRHIQKGVSVLLTRSPKSDAGNDLKQFNDTFIKLRLTKAQFMEQMEIYLKTHLDYINEMSEIDPAKYRHTRLRKALNKYNLNHKYMFTFQTNPQLQTQIPNTTNHIDGGVFSPLKRAVDNHPGTTKQRRKGLVILFLNSRGKSIT
jgi:hypothetical protein